MSNDPDQIRAEIEATRNDLSANVNALTDSVSPGNMARRQVDRVGDTFSSLKEQVMGSSDPGSGSGSGRTKVTADGTGSGAGAVTQRTRGNPLAAGLVAFGAGMLLGSLLPTSTAEQQVASTLKDKAQPLTDNLTDAAKSVAADLKEPATDAAESVKAVASDAAGTVKDESQSTARDLKDSSQDSAERVKDSN